MPLCCISGCETNSLNDKLRKFLKFYRFPSVENESQRREVWIKATNKKFLDGASWIPDHNSLVCEKHFVNKCKSEDELSVSFNPTLCLNLETTSVCYTKKRQTEETRDARPAKNAKLCLQEDEKEVVCDTEVSNDGINLPSPDLPFIAVQSITNSQHLQPEARWGHSMSMVSKEAVLVVGGQGGLGDITKDCLWKLDLKEGKWTDLSRLSNAVKPGPRIGHTSVYDPLLRCMYLYGGMRRSKWCAGLFVFDIDHFVWSLVHENSKPSESRQSSENESVSTSVTPLTTVAATGTTADDSKFIVIDEETNSSESLTFSTTPSFLTQPSTTFSNETTSAELINTTTTPSESLTDSLLNTDSLLPPNSDNDQINFRSFSNIDPLPTNPSPNLLDTSPPLLSYHSCVSYKQRLYIYGGTTPSEHREVCNGHLYVFDCIDSVWSRPCVTGTIPPKRSGHSGSLVKNKMVVFGGWDAPLCFNDVHVFDIDTMVWCQPAVSGPTPSPRSWHSSCLLSSSRVLIHGGFNGVSTLNDMFVLNIDAQQWTSLFLQPPLRIRAGHTSICLPYRHENNARDQVLMLGGGDNDDLFYNDLVNVMVPIS